MYEKLITALDSTGVPYTLGKFPAPSETYTPPKPPVICYTIDTSQNVMADNRIYVRREIVSITLYTNHKDPETEDKLRNALTSAGYIYSTTEQSVDSDGVYSVTFQIMIGD